MSQQLNIYFHDQDGGDLEEIVISLQEKAYCLIKQGVKKFEFRRRWRKTACFAYIYRSGLKKELSACVVLGEPIFGSPEEIASIAEKITPGNGKAVYDYLLPTGGGYAIPIGEFNEFDPIPLSELKKINFHPPQFYTILSNHNKLKSIINEKTKGNLKNENQ